MSMGGDHPVRDETQPKAADRSLGELVSSLSNDLSGLITTQIEIAKLEVKQEVTKAARGAGFLAGGGLVGYTAVVLLSVALAWGLAVPLNPWAGFLIVGAIWAAAAAILALKGRGQLQEAGAPEQTMAELQADRDLAREVRA